MNSHRHGTYGALRPVPGVLLWIWLVLLASPCGAVTFHVAPDGNDAWTGRLERSAPAADDGPLATLQGARDRVRELQRRGPLTEPVEVVFADGVYPLSRTLVFTPEDSGTAEFPVVYRAASGARPVFSGGRRITGFRQQDDGTWAVSIPAAASGRWRFEQLWVNGQRAMRARSPNQDYFHVARVMDQAAQGAGKSAFLARPEDLAGLAGLSPAQLQRVTVVVYHAWETSRHHIAALDPATGLVRLTGPSLYPVGEIYQRYTLENFRAALDEPGEWFLDASGTLFYKPHPGEHLGSARVVAPAGPEQLLRFAGQPRLHRPVAHIVLQGLSFRYGQYLLPPSGHAAPQAEVDLPAAIEAEGAVDIVLKDCEVAHVGSHAVWFHRGSRDCRLVRAHLHDLGAGGVRIGDGLEVDLASRELQTEGIVVENSLIHGGGRIHAGGCGIWVGRSGHNRLSHNEIFDFNYTGISLGWVWGYQASLAVANLVAYNRIHHLGQGVLDDMGGIYTLGPSPGTLIRNNVIHDVQAYSYGGWGIYNDEGSSDLVMENNLVYRAENGSYYLHYGRNNLVRNNIFYHSQTGQIQRGRVERELALRFRNNIVAWSNGPLTSAGSLRGPTVDFENNLYWRTTGAVTFQGQTLKQRQAAGQDRGSLIADPRFVAAKRGDFRLRPGSPALKLGFKPFDPKLAGVFGGITQVAERQAAPAMKPVPPFRLADDFEATPAGDAPAYAHCRTDQRRDLVAVTDSLGADGSRRCLAIHDRPGLSYPYIPYFFYLPHHAQGVTVSSFDLRFEPGAQLYHQWRDGRSPFGFGPRFRIKDGWLDVGQQPLLELPAGVFIHFRVAAGLGADATGTWTLEVTLPGEPTRRFDNLSNGTPDWKRLDWLGFSSTAETRTVFYLDNLVIMNQ